MTREEMLVRLDNLELSLQGALISDEQRSDILDEISDIEGVVHGHNPVNEQIGQSLAAQWWRSRQGVSG